MAFAQQQRRPRHRSPPLEASTDDDELTSHSIPTIENHLLSLGQSHSHTITTSDSDTDWHGISSVIRSSSSDTTSSFSDVQLSPLPPPPPTATTSTSSILSMGPRRDSLISEPESYSSIRPSDTESFSDIDFVFGALPLHDGTGTFVEQSDLEDETTRHLQQTTTEHRLVTTHHHPTAAAPTDFEPASPSMPNILLPYGGIHVPSFAISTTNNSTLSPISTHYYSISPLDQPVPPQLQSTKGMASSDKQFPTDDSSADQDIKLTRKSSRNLDRIPTHHPSFPGTITSFAILSAIWNNLRRLTNHLIENDTYTADAFTTLVSEATLEGCLPFGSHLHMELAAGLQPVYANRRYEGLPGM